MSKKDKKKDHEGREIKQVFLSEDGSEETEVTSKIIKKEDADPAEGKPEPSVHADEHSDHAKHLGKKSPIRYISIAVVMVFSLILSMAVGVWLALWDSNRTFGELSAIVFAKETVAAAPADETAQEPKEETQSADTGDESLDEVPSDVYAGQDNGDAEEAPAEEEDDYGLTIADDTDGLTGVSKAGSDDEITLPGDDDAPAVIDPMADYPLPFSTVDESYFTDALFIGDSRLQGFGFWSGLPATYYCATGFQLYKYDTTNVVQTENGKVPIFEAMPYDAFTKIYIKVGLNELGYGTEENFENKYAELIDKLREYEPRAVIYVHGILPVTAAKSASDKAHNNPNIIVRNTALKDFAKNMKAYYLDAGPVVSDENGDLKPEMTSDGIHLKPEYMKVWREYLCEHAVVIE